MSFILDALQKAERERRAGEVPGLPVGLAVPIPPRSLNYWMAGALVTAVLAVGVLIGVVLRPPVSPAILARTTVAVPARATPAPGLLAPIAVEAAPNPIEISATPIRRRTITVVLKPVSPHLGANEASISAVHPTVTAAPKRVIPLKELPAAIQAELPAMNVLFHTYSTKPSERLVDINNKPLHEGDYLQAGLKLEEVTPEGMVFLYKGIRFSAGVR